MSPTTGPRQTLPCCRGSSDAGCCRGKREGGGLAPPADTGLQQTCALRTSSLSRRWRSDSFCTEHMAGVHRLVLSLVLPHQSSSVIDQSSGIPEPVGESGPQITIWDPGQSTSAHWAFDPWLCARAPALLVRGGGGAVGEVLPSP